jgi:DNA polymerase-3 subunit delta'
LGEVERRVALARGSPGVAVSVDLAAYERGRAGMLALIEAASGAAPFEDWLRYAESAAARKDRLEDLLRILYVLLEDLLWLRYSGEGIRNTDLRAELEALAGRVTFAWLRRAVEKVDELAGLLRRNIQKNIALDALILALRTQSRNA